MKLAIIGTRGIPNHHGGFEQFAEYFSVYAKQKGHDVYVYNSHNHPFQDGEYKGVKIIHKYDPEFKIGTAGQFIYDLNCILDAKKRGFDVFLQLGYTSSSIWSFLFPKKSVVITNMDGLEWKRSKYSTPVRRFLKHAEKWGAIYSDCLIADSIGIQEHLKQKYNKQSEFIPYGATIIQDPDIEVLKQYQLKPREYNLLIARMEPENNIEIILKGVAESKRKQRFMVIGNYEKTKFGRKMYKMFSKEENIQFLGGIYNQEHLNSLRYYANLYFHGHSVGGTNPSLLEAMACSSLIVAHDNVFNRSVLNENAHYFKSYLDIAVHIESLNYNSNTNLIDSNKKKLETDYSHEKICQQYLDFFEHKVNG